MSADPIKQAAQITKAYAEDGEGLTSGECKGAGFSDAQCNILVLALGNGAEGNITAEEQKKLEEVGFAQEFIQSLAGEDGNKALQSRVRWLADRINRKTILNYCWNNCDVWERKRGVQELWEIGPAAAPAVSTLIVALKDEEWDVRNSAVWALGKIGPAAAPAVPALIEALKDKDMAVRYNAAWALVEIDDPHAIPPLQKMIREDPDARCRQAAQESFDKLMEKFR